MRQTRELPPLVLHAVGELKCRLSLKFAERLREVRVFGSMARGEADEASDVDVLVVLDRVRTHADRVAPMEMAADVGLPSGLTIQALVLGEDELDFQRQKETALADAVDSDGIAI